MAALRQVALGFTEGSQATMSSAVRGGKGYALAEMVALGLPVPPGFTIATGVSRAFMEHGRLPRRLDNQLTWKLAELENATGRTFGGSTQPLLVSVRSGAPVSMPGMMDSILNVGLTPDSYQGLIALGGADFAADVYRRHTDQFGEANADLPILSISPREQLLYAIEAVLRSWDSERARCYRREQGIDDSLGTAVTVQAMAFGNLDAESCTGVVFSCNPANGAPGMYGEFLPQAQGEDVVSGKFTPQDIRDLQSWNPEVYAELDQHVATLSDHYDAIVDVEFTVESGKLFILQARKATRSPQAAAHFAVHRQWSGHWDHQQAVASLSLAEIRQLDQRSFKDAGELTPLASGLPASPGVASGRVALTSESACEMARCGMNVILVRPDTSPEDLPGMLVAQAVITYTGGSTCHAAVVARGLNKPAVISVGMGMVQQGDLLSVDGTTGLIFRGDLPLETAERTKEINLFLRWVRRTNRFQPRLDVGHVKQAYSANTQLGDFYLTEAMAQAVVGEEIEDEVLGLRNRVHQEVAESFAMYLMLAAAGELRHSEQFNHDHDGQFLPLVDRFQIARGLTRQTAHQRVVSAVARADLAEQTQFAAMMAREFRLPGWRNSGYGGSKWADIADALHGFLSGALTPTLFVDRAFDLRHNGGVLFNKHPMYAATHEESLRRQLDIKKAAGGVRNLYSSLNASYHIRIPARPFSPEVEDLYLRGIQVSAW